MVEEIDTTGAGEIQFEGEMMRLVFSFLSHRVLCRFPEGHVKKGQG